MTEQRTAWGTASIGNVCVGFDCLGLGLEQPGDRVTVSKRDEPGAVIGEITGPDPLIGSWSDIPRSSGENTASVAVAALLEATAAPFGVSIDIEKGISIGSGLGSSAASSVGALIAANALLPNPLSQEELISYAMLGEQAACGSAHADNATPALLGGLNLIQSYDPFRVVRIPVPEELWVCVIHPAVILKTSEARSVLPKEVPLRTASQQLGLMGGFLSAVRDRDWELLRASFADLLVEPYRAGFIPFFHEMRAIAVETGAFGLSIAGSGPTLFTLSLGSDSAERIGTELKQFLEGQALRSEYFCCSCSNEGSSILGET